MLALARILAVIFAVLVISKSYLSYKSRKESLTMTLFWSATWVIILIVAFLPGIIDRLLGDSGAKAGIGTILGIGLIFIYFIIYRVYVKADRIEKQLAKMIRESSARGADKIDKN